MLVRKSLLVLVGALTIVALWVGQGVSQQQNGDEDRQSRRQRRQQSSEETRQRAAQRAAQMNEQMRVTLGVNEAKWAVLQPKIEKVQTLLRQSSMGMRGMMGRFGGRGGPRGGSEAQSSDQAPVQREQTDLEKSRNALRQLLTNSDASVVAIRRALVDFRRDRDRSSLELSEAREELRGAVNLRKEAQLVLMGILD